MKVLFNIIRRIFISQLIEANMKFSKNLQQVVDKLDPEWTPYWANYKMMKKIIKRLKQAELHTKSNNISVEGKATVALGSTPTSKRSRLDDPCLVSLERTFFKVVNAELRKAIHFFGRAVQEFGIREERLREGILIMKKPGYIMESKKWASLGKSLCKLNKDLVLLEKYSVMTYCAFSKILKKHDKCTGCVTRMKFMTRFVNNANFTNNADVSRMIKTSKSLYDEVAQNLSAEWRGRINQDERLFINMIQLLNGHVLSANSTSLPEGDTNDDSTTSSASDAISCQALEPSLFSCSHSQARLPDSSFSSLTGRENDVSSAGGDSELDDLDDHDEEQTKCKRQRLF